MGKVKAIQEFVEPIANDDSEPSTVFEDEDAYKAGMEAGRIELAEEIMEIIRGEEI